MTDPRRCTATRQPDDTYRCPCGLRWDTDLTPITEETT